MIELTVGLHEPLRWLPFQQHLENMLKVLTGDHWTLRFVAGAHLLMADPRSLCTTVSRYCRAGWTASSEASILWPRGGDQFSFLSLPMRIRSGSGTMRRASAVWARTGSGATALLQWTARNFHSGSFTSLLWLCGVGCIAHCWQSGSGFVPENGFICINPPLVPGRVSSLSTRTTHPQFIEMLQALLDGLAVPVTLELPYRFKTKGQMLQQCQDQALLRAFAAHSTSCGRFRTYNRKHCGRCVPCMIRKAAFLAWDPAADTTSTCTQSSWVLTRRLDQTMRWRLLRLY